ncbi:hypothetical protein DS62_11750 [Smithella sp. SC_K08D17]|nr:hypothetical protein DS62_11750 [Smithella sp. SC_K08D17]
MAGEDEFKVFLSKIGMSESLANSNTLGAMQPFKTIFGYTVPGTNNTKLDHVEVFAGNDRSGMPWVLTRDGYRIVNDGVLSDDNRYQFRRGTSYNGMYGPLLPAKIYQKRNK